VEDGANVYMLLAHKLAENSQLKGDALKFSLEVKLTVLELVDYILKLMKSDLKPEILNQANNEIKSQFLSSKKAREILK
jgi:CDP-glucose 4,6-dehydratase